MPEGMQNGRERNRARYGKELTSRQRLTASRALNLFFGGLNKPFGGRQGIDNLFVPCRGGPHLWNPNLRQPLRFRIFVSNRSRRSGEVQRKRSVCRRGMGRFSVYSLFETRR